VRIFVVVLVDTFEYCFIIIFYLIGSKRDDENGSTSPKLINELLDQMNTIREHPGDGVFLIAATNRYISLDSKCCCYFTAFFGK
jgi:SpoVK/Ycf46/Vps4 family AAA+-type ATPase